MASPRARKRPCVFQVRDQCCLRRTYRSPFGSESGAFHSSSGDHELRRYVRVPIVTEASIEAENKRIPSSTLEVSAGGMSLVCSSKLHLGHSVQVNFSLPILNGGNVKVKASVCWARENENAYGVRFDATDDRRLQVKRWIDE